MMKFILVMFYYSQFPAINEETYKAIPYAVYSTELECISDGIANNKLRAEYVCIQN
jgi:hypothetical protein